MMKKKDGILILIVLIIAAIFFLWNQKKAALDGERVVITVDGKQYGIYNLKENNEIEISSKYGYNKLIIKNGEAFMEQADCNDHYCETMGKIKRNGESIICLPHKVVIEIEADSKQNKNQEEQEKEIQLPFDAVVK